MSLRKVFREVVVDNLARFRDDGSSDSTTVRLETSRTPTELVVEDEVNALDQLRLPQGDDLNDVLNAGGVHELVVSALLNFDAEAVLIGTGSNQPAAGTADRLYVRTDAAGGPVVERDDGTSWNIVGASPGALSDGGAAELDAADLAGSAGTDGQVLQTDGAATTWANATGIGRTEGFDIAAALDLAQSPHTSEVVGSSETVTVPSGEDWFIQFTCGGNTDSDGSVNGTNVAYIPRDNNYDNGSHFYATTLTGGDSISFNTGGFLTAWLVSDISNLTPISQVLNGGSVTVPNGETWAAYISIGGNTGGDWTVDGTQVAYAPRTNMGVTAGWSDRYGPDLILDAGRTLGTASGQGAHIGGFKI